MSSRRVRTGRCTWAPKLVAFALLFCGVAATAQDADLNLTKGDAPDPVIAGNQLTYTLNLDNNAGLITATGIVLTDTLPAGVTFVSAVPGGPTCTHSLGVVTCNLPNLAPGASTVVTITVSVPACTTDGLMLSNMASVSTTAMETNLANNDAAATTTVNRSANLVLTKADGPDPVVAGTGLAYTLTLQNLGPSCADNVQITDPLDMNVSFVSATAPCVDLLGTVTCNLGSDVPVGNTVLTINVTVDPCAPAMLSNTATVTSTTSDPTPGNESDPENTTALRRATFTITKTDSPDPVVAGTNIDYSITFTNNGPSCANNVVITDTLPGSVSFLSSTPGAPTCTEAAGVVTCNLGSDVAPGVTNVDITGFVSTCGPNMITNNVVVNSTTINPMTMMPATASDSESTTVIRIADLDILTGDNLDTTLVCQRIDYRVTLVNNGPSCANNVVVTNTLPGAVQFLSVTPGGPTCTEGGGIVTCNLGNSFPVTPPAAPTLIDIFTVMDDFSIKGLAMVDTVTVTSSTTDPDLSNNTHTDTTQVKDAEPYIMSMTGSPRFLRHEYVLSEEYVIKFESLCDPLVTTTNVTVTSLLPNGINFLGSAPGPIAEDGNTFTFLYPTMVGGTIEQITMNADLSPDTPTGSLLRHDAFMVDDQGNRADDHVITGVRSAGNAIGDGSLIVRLTTVSHVPEDSRVLSTVAVDNTSLFPAENVVVTLSAPDGVELVSALPPPTGGDGTTLVWDLGALNGPGKKRIQIRHYVPPGLAGSQLFFGASVGDGLGRGDSDERTITVR